MTKEEYLKEHGVSERAFLIYCINVLVDDDIRINGDNINDLKGFLYELVDDYFELKEKYSKILDDVHDYRYETHCMKMTMRNLCEHFGVKSEKELQNIYLSKPYKFEDLHEGMWVWDDIEKLICQIGLISKNAIHRKYIDGTISDSPFEEKRFFPVQYANLIKMGVKDDGTQKSTDD